MTKLTRYLALSLLLGCAATAQAQEQWKLAASTDDGTVIHYKLLTRSASIVTFWQRIHDADGTYLSHTQVDCEHAVTRWASWTHYDRNDTVMEVSGRQWSAWTDVIPDSVGEEIMRTVCIPTFAEFKRGLRAGPLVSN